MFSKNNNNDLITQLKKAVIETIESDLNINTKKLTNSKLYRYFLKLKIKIKYKNYKNVVLKEFFSERFDALIIIESKIANKEKNIIINTNTKEFESYIVSKNNLTICLRSDGFSVYDYRKESYFSAGIQLNNPSIFFKSENKIVKNDNNKKLFNFLEYISKAPIDIQIDCLNFLFYETLKTYSNEEKEEILLQYDVNLKDLDKTEFYSGIL